MNQLNFMSDQGTNLLKTVQGYHILNCFSHCMNNILKKAFFQLKSNRTLELLTLAQTTTSLNTDSDLNDTSDLNSLIEDK